MLLLKVAQSLNKHKVRFAVVGGYAVSLHGAVRGTIDLDLVIALNQKSFEMTEKALQEVGLVSKLPVSARDVFQFRDEYIENRNLIAWSFFNPTNPSELVDVMITEDLKKLKTINKAVHGQSVPVAALNSLIEMKKKSERVQDREDVKALEYLKETEK